MGSDRLAWKATGRARLVLPDSDSPSPAGRPRWPGAEAQAGFGRWDGGDQSASRAGELLAFPVTAYTISTQPPERARCRSSVSQVSGLSGGASRIPDPNQPPVR